MSENLVQFKIDVDIGGMKSAVRDAIGELTDSINEIKNSFVGLTDSINKVLEKVSESAKDTADTSVAVTNNAMQKLTGSVKASVNTAVGTVNEAINVVSSNTSSSMRRVTDKTNQTAKSITDDGKNNVEEGSSDTTLIACQDNISNKLANYKKQTALNDINSEEEKLQILRNQGAMSQEQLIQAKKDFEKQRYDIERESLEKSLVSCAKNADDMIMSYKKYVNARDEATRKMIREEMFSNCENQQNLKNTLEQLTDLDIQYTDKQKLLDKSLMDEKLKKINQIRDTMKSSMEQAFQDIMNGSTTVKGALKNIFSSTKKAILNQLKETLVQAIKTQANKKLFDVFNINKKSDSKNEKSKNVKQNITDKAKVLMEKTTQDQLTALNAQGNAKRLAQDQATSNEQITATQVKANNQLATETIKDQGIIASAKMAGKAAVDSIKTSLQAMVQMLPTLLLMSALTRLFGGGGDKTTESTGEGINLGRNPDSYYQTPSLVTSVPSFDVGAWRLPFDTLAMVHAGEMIVPAKGGLADNMRSMLESGGGQSSSPTFNLSYSAAHYGRTNRDVQNEMKQNAKFLIKTLNGEYRNFNRGKA